MPIALRPLRNPNPLGFPGGILPGFDPSHVAAQGITPGHGFSGIANSGFVNILTGKPGTKNSTPTAALTGIGPVQLFPSGTVSYTFAGQATTNDIAFSVAAIVSYTAITANSDFFCSSGSTLTGVVLTLAATNMLGFVFPGGGSVINMNLPITLVNSVPYFVVASAIQSGGNFVWNWRLTNLQTGQTYKGSGTTASTGPVAPNGTYMVGNSPAGSRATHGYLAACAFIPSYLSAFQQQQWAQDPWSFWYPRTLDLTQVLVGVSAATFKAAWAMNSNLPVLGTGTY